MSELGALRELLSVVERAGGCTNPVRLAGTTVDLSTGELWTGTVPVSCKDRRAAICPACAARYRADAWHLVAAGLRGGKGVPASVADHPAVFATLTAPSFGPVHARRDRGPCHPRRGSPVCPHGRSLACHRTHTADDASLGEPLCPECFAYRDAVLWNAHAGRLYNRTVILVRRLLAAVVGHGEADREPARLSYVKVAEFQGRGLVHFHVVARLDGTDGPTSEPPGWATVEVLRACLEAGITGATVAGAGGGQRIGWGTEADLRVIGTEHPEGPADPGAVAAYLAKYSTKSSEASGALARRVRSDRDPVIGHLRPHLARLVRTAWDLGGEEELARLRLREHAHTFGFPGHFATKSARYSTTFGALRAARADHRRGGSEVQGAFDYLGRGYPDPRAALLAEALSEAGQPAPRAREAVPRGFPGTSPGVPRGFPGGSPPR